ncbi:HDOD domain-containing protein, partial [bacterium]|nr:HDOD domain-containing protein [bacterium]
MSKKKIFEQIEKSKSLPQLPQVMVKLIKACNSEETNIDELTSIISIDPGLTSKLLQIVGSAYINLPQKVNNIKTAVVYLGIDTIKNIAISTSAMHFFKTVKSVPEFNINQFWYHSYKCGVLARKIAKVNDLPNPDEFFLAGLLHDIGKLVLLDNFPEDYNDILKKYSNENLIFAAEIEKFDINTPEITEWLFKKWELNPLIADSVLFINESIEQIESALFPVKIIFISNLLAQQDSLEKISDILALTEISKSSFKTIVIEAQDEVQEMAKSLGINIENTKDIAKDTACEKELASQIKDISLLYGTLQNLLQAKEIESILEISQNGFKIIFNIQRMFYFMLDDGQNILTGLSIKNDKAHQIIKNIALPLSNHSSLIVKGIKQQKPQNSFGKTLNQKPAVSDIQIARLLDAKGLYCIPLFSSNKAIGVMVLGIDDKLAKHLEDNKELVKLFSKQISVCIQNIKFHKDFAKHLHEKKMDAYSMLTDKVIHEINNPIAIIKNYIGTLGFKLPEKHPAQEELTVINEEMSRVAGLLDRLRSFSNPTIGDFEFVDINKICKGIFELLQKSLLLPRRIKASIDLDPEIPMVKTDINGLKQIFINLVKNAAEALESIDSTDGKSDKITVSTRFLPESAKIMIDEKKKIPGNIEIKISDNGPGIDEKLKDSLFEPYT